MALCHSVREPLRLLGDAETFHHQYHQRQQREPLGISTYPFRGCKPDLAIFVEEFTNPSWHCLDKDGSPGSHVEEAKHHRQVDADNDDMLGTDYLAYLSLVDADTSSPKSGSSAVQYKNHSDEGGLEKYCLTDGDLERELEQIAQDSQSAIGPALDQSSATAAVAEEGESLPRPELSPTASSFLQRGFSVRRRSLATSYASSTRSSISLDRGSQSGRSSNRISRDSKAGWLSQIKEWTSVAEPSSQALKQHKAETFKRAGIAIDDPLAKARLKLPSATLPPTAIKPAGRPLKAEEVKSRQAEELKKGRWSISSAGRRFSHASRASTSGHSSTSSVG